MRVFLGRGFAGVAEALSFVAFDGPRGYLAEFCSSRPEPEKIVALQRLISESRITQCSSGFGSRQRSGH
jgi:hypothetical protein